jgi:hypothetical protein
MCCVCRYGLTVLMHYQVLNLYLAELSIRHTHLMSSVPGQFEYNGK